MDKILFRCSGLHHLMTEPRSKSELISESMKTHLVDVFVSWKYKRKEEITSKFIDKGNEREEDAITLLSLIDKTFYSKNDQRLFNDFIQGEVDLFKGESITKAEKTLDTKTSWSAHTYFRSISKPLDKSYYYQGLGYMALTGAEHHEVCFCLVNGTEKAINDEKRRLAYSMGVLDPSNSNNEEFKKRCRQIEINHIFDIKAFEKEYPWFELDNDISKWAFDIPKEKRVFKFIVNRDEFEIEKIYKKCELGINWINDELNK